jgi:hypothetical protein
MKARTAAVAHGLMEEREDHGAADMVDSIIKALNDPAFFKP